MKPVAMIEVLLSALAMAACTTIEEPSEPTGQPSVDADGATESRDLPAGLISDVIGPHVIIHHGSCLISIVCHNPAFGNLPTFCTNGAPCQGNGPIWAPGDCLNNCPQPGTRCALGHNLTQMRQCL
jgi:hypothetical protein